ncbi:DoxX family protein [soil metagenome]
MSGLGVGSSARPPATPTPARRIALVITGVLFSAAGVNHFIMPAFYERIVPVWLTRPAFVPSAATLVVLSGAFEILGGLSLLVPRLRRAAAWGLIALLVAVFPANVEMVVNEAVGAKAIAAQTGTAAALSQAILIARLPLQAVMIAWVYWSAARKP